LSVKVPKSPKHLTNRPNFDERDFLTLN